MDVIGTPFPVTPVVGQSLQLSLDLGEVCLLYIGFQVALPCVSRATSLSFPLRVTGVSMPCDVGYRLVESMTYPFSAYLQDFFIYKLFFHTLPELFFADFFSSGQRI